MVVLMQMFNAPSIETAGPADQAMDLVAFFQEKFG
jgi:hypothetical protein